MAFEIGPEEVDAAEAPAVRQGPEIPPKHGEHPMVVGDRGGRRFRPRRRHCWQLDCGHRNMMSFFVLLFSEAHVAVRLLQSFHLLPALDPRDWWNGSMHDLRHHVRGLRRRREGASMVPRVRPFAAQAL